MNSDLYYKLRRMYRTTSTIAVVGASADRTKPAGEIPRFLQLVGFTIRPVNPRGGFILGEPVARTLTTVRRPIDIVDVFRPAEEVPDIARAAVEIGAKILWMQVGVESDEGKSIAESAGMTVVMNRCLGATYHRVGLGPDPRELV